MIIVTRLNGPALALNPDLVQRAECTPDTVITLVDGTKYVVEESVEVLVERIRDFRASVICAAHQMEIESQECDGYPARPIVNRAPEPSHPRLSSVAQLPVRQV